MDKHEHLFSSESVTEGHPDKIADQISDAILDAALTDDPFSRVACETLTTTGLVMVSGEISTQTYIDIPRVVRDVGQGRRLLAFVVRLRPRDLLASSPPSTSSRPTSPRASDGPTRSAPTSTTTTSSTARAPATRA